MDAKPDTKQPHLAVLIVDDEPDIIKITEMSLRNMRMYGAKIKIISCNSKANAIAYLTGPDRELSICVALIDVVMETEHAGLELCAFIRSELNNFTTPLYIRTGQAGKAPEKKVLEEYNVTGYLNKTELTAEKLFSIVYGASKGFRGRQPMYFASMWLSATIDLLINKKLTPQAALLELGTRSYSAIKPENFGVFSGFAMFYKGELVYSIGSLLNNSNLLNEIKDIPPYCKSEMADTYSKQVETSLLTFHSGDFCYMMANPIEFPYDMQATILRLIAYPMNTLLNKFG